MPKDRFYFQHDYNARNDRKIAALVKKHKAAGYGIFWVVCEMMHEEGGGLEFDEITFGAIAKDINEETEFIKTVLNDCVSEFKLFSVDGDCAKSNRVTRNLDKRQEVSKSRANAGKAGANAKQMLLKERKEKEIKEIRGLEFLENNTKILFSDGTEQEIGEQQRELIAIGDLKPGHVKKGVSF